ncbi:MAG TPA: M14 family metallopeptidase [Saprospiraceae bacterium]|nr:M14 family metallopeptidase [Saprospiraceae bacterium]
MRNFIIIPFLLTFLQGHLYSQNNTLKSPDQFLTYKLGSRFTPHHLLVDYFKHADEASNKIKLIEYGKTYELRPLIAAIISSPQNMARLEEIRMNNLYRTGLAEGQIKKDDIAIVYLSYSVHGNEAAGSECSMQVLYELAMGSPDIDKWLANTIVIIDPSLNPDGYARFSDWSNQVSSIPNDPHAETREHNEPWPGGRLNHYYFDLNRDWAWQTQKESRDRIAFYLQWMPHIHADIHEMGPESPYFFAPSADPIHEYVTPWQRSFQEVIGKNNAKHFDKEGWRYFTKENYDLFYPSYGDTYPTFSGAIGMTYEEGGSGYSNRAILLANGDTLTLSDRIAHHRMTSLSTIEAGSNHAAALVKEFELYFTKSNQDPPGKFKNYVVSKLNQAGRIKDLTTLLDRNGIRYGILKSNAHAIKVFNYLDGENISMTPQAGDIVIPAAQPRGVLLKALFDPESLLTDSLTYDISAWSVPMAYGLDAIATEEKLDFSPYVQGSGNIIKNDAKPYAYIIEWGSVSSSNLLSSLLSEGLVARFAKYEFKVGNVLYPQGTILFMRGDNRKIPAFDDLIREKASSSIVRVATINTGFVELGKDLGSNDYPLVRIPQVLSIAGEGVSSQNIGQVWHFFEEELKYPIHLVLPEDLENVNLNNYNIIVIPEGNYHLEIDFMNKLNSWVRSGGHLIAIGTGIRQLAGKNDFSIKVKTIEEDSAEIKKEKEKLPDPYASTDRKQVSEELYGVVFQTRMDQTNPLSFGLGKYYMTLKTNPSSYAWLPAEGNAIYFDENQKYYGFAGSKAIKKMDRSLVAGFETIGGGSVVYLVDNPLFRSFWNSGKVLFSNALFF